MGMYTKFHVHLRFKEDAPASVIKTIKLMLNPYDDSDGVDKVYHHGRIKHMLKGGSYYHCIRPSTQFWFDEIAKQWILNATCDFKNYDDDINTFMSFVFPYVEHRGYAGYKLYEEDEHPTLIYLEEGAGMPLYRTVL